MEFLNDVNFSKFQALNIVLHSLATPPDSPVNAQIYHNSSTDTIFYYKASNSAWIPIGAGTIVGGDGLGESTVNGITTLSVKVDGSTLEIVTDTVQVKDGGITGSKLATNSVTAAKIVDATISLAKLQNIGTMTVLGRTAAGAGSPSEITIINSNSLVGASGTSLATSGAIKAYVDGLVGGIGTLVGSFDANTSTTFPGTATVKKGSYWYVSAAGVINAADATNAVSLDVGDMLIANKDNPSTTLRADWIFIETNRGQATTTILGMMTIATVAEVQTGSDSVKAVTSSTLSARTATEARTGLAQIATQVIVDLGVNDSMMVTPLKMAVYVASKISGGGFVAIIGNATETTHAITHGLNSKSVNVSIRRVSDGSEVIIDNKATSPTVLTVVSGRPLGVGAFEVTILKK